MKRKGVAKVREHILSLPSMYSVGATLLRASLEYVTLLHMGGSLRTVTLATFARGRYDEDRPGAGTIEV